MKVVRFGGRGGEGRKRYSVSLQVGAAVERHEELVVNGSMHKSYTGLTQCRGEKKVMAVVVEERTLHWW